MAEHAELVEKEGGVEMLAEEKGHAWKKAVRTRFGTQLAQFDYCHQYLQKVCNYVSTLEVKKEKKAEDKEEEEKKKRKQAKLKSAKAQLANSDELEEGFEFLSYFSPLQPLLAKLESRQMVVSEASAVVDEIRRCLLAAQDHPQNTKHRTAEKALTKFESVVRERFSPLAELAKVNPLYEHVPYSSIKVEADFSIVKHNIGDRKNFLPENLEPHLQVVLHQKSVAAAARVSYLNLYFQFTSINFLQEQRKRAASQDGARRSAKRVKATTQVARQDHTY